MRPLKVCFHGKALDLPCSYCESNHPGEREVPYGWFATNVGGTRESAQMKPKEEMARELERLKSEFRKIMPIIEEAFWDHHTAGVMPGSGYNHRVYRKVSDIFGWRDSSVFTEWKKSLGLGAEAEKESG